MAESIYRVRPSSLDRVLACPGSLQMEERFPQAEESEGAKEGTAAHECFSMEWYGLPYTVGATANNGVTIDADMLEAGSEFVDFIRSWATPYTYVEQQIPCAAIHPQCGGTPDAWGWIPEQYLIKVADMKYGHRFVDVVDCAQLAAYTSGIADFLNIDGHTEQFISVEWTIYQPRCYQGGGTWKTHTYRLSDLRQLWNKLIAAANEALTAHPRCIPSEQCRDCTGRHACVALQRSSASITDFTARTIEDFTLTAEQAGKELQRLHKAQAVLEARIEGLEEQAIAEIKRGRRVPGYEVKHSKGRERWIAGKEAEAGAMAQLLNLDIYKPRELITPTQARKLGFDTSLIEATETPTGSAKLVAVNTNETAKIFGDK